MDESTNSAATNSFADLHRQINEALTARSMWESKVASAYKVRHCQVSPRSRPWKNSSDLNFPLSDGFIDKLKPFYIGQLYGSETVAKFVSCDPAQTGSEAEIEKWFDYVLKQDSNLEQEISVAVDNMLEVSPSHVKTYWDNNRRKLCFDAIEPLNIIVPDWTRDLADVDWIVQVMELSVDAFKRDPRFRDFAKSKANLEKVTGTGGTERIDKLREEYKAQREGITYSKKDRIAVWEVWRRDKVDGDKFIVEYRSPIDDEVELRDKHISPFGKGKEHPFTRLQTEIKDKGHYSSRGIPEKMAQLEASLTKMWQDKHNHMTLSNRPLFKSTIAGSVPGNLNLSWNPGDILGANIEAITMPPPPVSYDEEMNSTRNIAENYLQLPDFGIQEENGGARTLGELKLRAGQSGQSNDLRARNFRRSLGEIYNKAWAILAEYKPEIQYLDGDALKTLGAQAFSGKYIIHPSGSADGWDREGAMQRAVGSFQMFNGDQMTNQIQLRKNIWDAQSPLLTRIMVIDPGVNLANETAKQVTELTDMIVTSFPIQINAGDDDCVHLQTCGQWVMAQAGQGKPIDPHTAVIVVQHMAAHEKAAMAKKAPQLQQTEQQVAQAVQILSSIANAAKQQAAMGQHTLPQQPGAGTHTPSSNIPPASPGPAMASPSPQPMGVPA